MLGRSYVEVGRAISPARGFHRRFLSIVLVGSPRTTVLEDIEDRLVGAARIVSPVDVSTRRIARRDLDGSSPCPVWQANGQDTWPYDWFTLRYSADALSRGIRQFIWETRYPKV